MEGGGQFFQEDTVAMDEEGGVRCTTPKSELCALRPFALFPEV